MNFYSIIMSIFILNLCLAEHQNGTENGIIEPNEDIQILVEDALDWARHAGLIMRTKDHLNKSDLAEVPPFTLFPSPFPHQIYEQAYNVQESLALIYFRMASDYEFLVETYKEVRKSDQTVAKLMDILADVRQKGFGQPVGLMLIRADYMCHVNDEAEIEDTRYELKQIEVNIGSIGGTISDATTSLHRRMISKAGMEVTNTVLPDNHPNDTMAQGLYMAWKYFGNPKAIILNIIGKLGNKTQFEMRATEYKLDELSDGQIRNIYLNYTECYQRLRLGDDNSLLLDNHVVAVVNFRLARTIHAKFIDAEKNHVWTMVEQSTAIKSPSLSMELASTKKIQQVLAEKGVVERFFPDPKDADKVAAIRRIQAGLWSLDHDDKHTKSIIKDAILYPKRYVLKPNRDGGGNNFWDKEITKKLMLLKSKERSQFILMQRLRPLATKNYLKRLHSDASFESVVTELSVFGALLGNQRTGVVLHQRHGGHLMRTKPEHINEGGVQMGAGFHDSPFLF